MKGRAPEIHLLVQLNLSSHLMVADADGCGVILYCCAQRVDFLARRVLLFYSKSLTDEGTHHCDRLAVRVYRVELPGAYPNLIV